MITIDVAQSPADIEEIRALFTEYAASLYFDLCFQDFDTELASLPGSYAAPDGCLFLARAGNGQAAGCVGIRRLVDGGAEMKRLYVRADWRGQGMGRRLADSAIEFARAAGYQALRLDTIPDQMANADAMYRAMGFEETAAYYDNPRGITRCGWQVEPAQEPGGSAASAAIGLRHG
ncbi:MAG: GNAT family N-acetyltransferase [Alphaproteobacteria bacterium]